MAACVIAPARTAAAAAAAAPAQRARRAVARAQAKKGGGFGAKPKSQAAQPKKGFGRMLGEDTGAEVIKSADAADAPCMCGSAKTHAECCAPLIAGKRDAATADELLRARYSAYKLASDRAVEFIIETTHPDHLKESKRTAKELRDDTELTCKQCCYDDFKVLEAGSGDASADEDTVRFRVWFRFVKYFKGEKRGKKRSSLEYGPETTNTETSVFRKEGGKWKFVKSTERDDAPYKKGDTGAAPATDFLSLAKRAMGQR